MTNQGSEGRWSAVLPWILLFAFSLSYPFVPAAFGQVVGADFDASVRTWVGVYGVRALVAALVPLAVTALIYLVVGRRWSAALRIAVSAPVWPLSSLLLFEVAPKPAQVSEISVYLSIVLSLLFHFCGELGLLRRRLPRRAGRSAWDVRVSWTLGLTFVGLIVVVPPLFLMMRVLGIQTPGPNPQSEWFTVGSFSAHALFYVLLGTLLFLRLPRNVAYLMRLPPEPCRVFISYAGGKLVLPVATRGLEELSGWGTVLGAKLRRLRIVEGLEDLPGALRQHLGF